jgi:YEATS domain-containing protein 4
MSTHAGSRRASGGPASGAQAGSGASRSDGGLRRVRGTILHVPIVHGSHAVWQGPRGRETRSHRWWLYLRPLDNVDISHFIKCVEFVLHESFDPAVRSTFPAFFLGRPASTSWHARTNKPKPAPLLSTYARVEVTEMPYEISEYGWGEFDAMIRVHFHDPSEKSVEFFHPLKLFATAAPIAGPGGAPGPVPELSRRPVVHEFYDEIVFQDPSERLLGLLKTTPHGPSTRLRPSLLAPYFTDFGGCESADLKRIEDARRRVREETGVKQARYEALQVEREELLREIAARGGGDVDGGSIRGGSSVGGGGGSGAGSGRVES